MSDTEDRWYLSGPLGIDTPKPHTKLHIVSKEGADDPGYGNPMLWGQHIELAASEMWGLNNSYGILHTWESDSLFIGLKDEGLNRKDAIIAYGDDPQDSLRFMFTPSGNPPPEPKELLRITSDGNVGIGTNDPKARLSVVAADATQITKGVQSSLLRVSAGTLKSQKGSEIVLASVGFPPGDNSGLVIRALRLEDGSDSNTTGFGISRNYDSSIIFGQRGLWFHPEHRIGINTSNPQATLDVGGGIKVSGDIVVSGGISSSRWNVAQLLSSQSGALPLSAGSIAGGGVALILVSGSGYSAEPNKRIGMKIILDDDTEIGSASTFTNEKESHKAFVGNAIVTRPSGTVHTIKLVAESGTGTDQNDLFSVTVINFPF